MIFRIRAKITVGVGTTGQLSGHVTFEMIGLDEPSKAWRQRG